MKKRYIALILAAVLLFVLFKWCGRWQYASYYEKTENYVSAAGTVTHIADDEEFGLFLEFKDMTTNFSDTLFVFRGKNREIVLEKGILEKLAIGDRVEFVTNGWYAGDGYAMPIVAICVDGEWLLEFEDGYENLVEFYWTS